MGQSVEQTQREFNEGLKAIAKFKPAPYLKADFDKFQSSVRNLMQFLDGAVETSDVKTARADFAKNKAVFDRAKAVLLASKKVVNDAQANQVTRLKNAQGARGDVASSAQALMSVLKGKIGTEAELSKAIFNFSTKVLPKVADAEVPSKIDDVI